MCRSKCTRADFKRAEAVRSSWRPSDSGCAGQRNVAFEVNRCCLVLVGVNRSYVGACVDKAGLLLRAFGHVRVAALNSIEGNCAVVGVGADQCGVDAEVAGFSRNEGKNVASFHACESLIYIHRDEVFIRVDSDSRFKSVAREIVECKTAVNRELEGISRLVVGSRLPVTAKNVARRANRRRCRIDCAVSNDIQSRGLVESISVDSFNRSRIRRQIVIAGNADGLAAVCRSRREDFSRRQADGVNTAGRSIRDSEIVLNVVARDGSNFIAEGDVGVNREVVLALRVVDETLIIRAEVEANAICACAHVAQAAANRLQHVFSVGFASISQAADSQTVR